MCVSLPYACLSESFTIRVVHHSHLCLALPLAPFTMPVSMPCGYTLWEMRCPRGRQCGKNNRLINKKTTRALAAQGLASHLFDVHEDITTWNQALRIADDDVYITESIHTYDEVPVDPDGSIGKGKGKGEPSMTTIDESIAGMDSLASDCERMARRIRTESAKLQKAKDLIETMSKRPRSPAPPPEMKRGRRPSTW